MNNEAKALMDSICETKEAKRIQELEAYIDSNIKINTLFSTMKELQKQMVNAKHLEMDNTYITYKQEYNKVMEEILSYPFMEEYFDLLENLNSTLAMVCKTIEDEINEDLID